MKVEVIVYLIGATVLEVVSQTGAMCGGLAIGLILFLGGANLHDWLKRRAALAKPQRR